MELTMNLLKEAIDISNSLAKEKSRITPYHFNLIDEIITSKVYENAHSRILAKILQYKRDDHFIFLQSFLENIDIDKTVSNPAIDVEKHEIDVLIRDRDYAVIIENKINYASDQPNQLKRYINTVKDSYGNKPIFVLYLTRLGKKIPSEESLSEDDKKNLGTNYKEINYTCHVLPWLEEKVLPECRLKENILSSAINQYIDHLKGILNKREMREMDEQLKKSLKEKLNIEDTLNPESIRIIENKIEELDECKKYLEDIKKDMKNERNALRKEFIKKLHRKLNNDDEWICVEDASHDDSIDIDKCNNIWHFGFMCNNKELSLTLPETTKKIHLRVEFSNWRERILCGLFFHGELLELEDELTETLKKKDINIIKSKGVNLVWIFLNPDEYKNHSDIARDFSNYSLNKRFAEEMDAIVETFYEQITKFYNAWKEICKELDYKISL